MESSPGHLFPTKSPPVASRLHDRIRMLTMEEALRQSPKTFAAGQIVKGTILELRPKEVLVDIGYKSEGVISLAEFEDPKAARIGEESKGFMARCTICRPMV